jgi:hypothetical protein
MGSPTWLGFDFILIFLDSFCSQRVGLLWIWQQQLGMAIINVDSLGFFLFFLYWW